MENRNNKKGKTFFYRLYKEKSGKTYLKIWKYENGKEVYVRSCGTAEGLNRKLERFEVLFSTDQEK